MSSSKKRWSAESEVASGSADVIAQPDMVHASVFTLPPVIGAVLDDKGAKQGNVENGGYTDDSRPQIVGDAEPGAIVHIYDGVELLGRVTADADGVWSFIPRLPLLDGEHVLSIIHESKEGDIGDASEPYVIHVDKLAPDIPVISGVQDDEGKIVGGIASGDTTDDNQPTVDGTTEPNATVIVYDKGNEIGRVQADAAGKWSFTPEPALADGTHILEYIAVDRAGNQSEKSASFEFLVDTRQDQVNIDAADDAAGNITGLLASGSVTDDTLPALQGTATAGGLVNIYEGAELLGQTIAGVDGRWVFTPTSALAEGVHTLHATVTLPAKGESERSPAFTLTIDTTAPDKPAIVELVDNAGSQQGVLANGAATDDSTPILIGKAEAGSTVYIYDNGNYVASALADAHGNWSHASIPSLSDGQHTLTVVAEDKAGNTSVQSDGYVVVVDTVAPAQPVIESVYDDAGRTVGMLVDGDVTDDAKPTISGTAEGNSTVLIMADGNEIGRAIADASGQWSFEPSVPLSWGAHELTAVAIDAVGNTSQPSEGFSLTVENSGDDYVDLAANNAPASVTFIVDISGSMSGQTLVELKESLAALANAYAESGRPTTFNLVAFADHASNRGTFTFSNTGDDAYIGLMGAINGLVAAGGTNMGAGLTIAANLIKQEYSAANADPYMSKQVFLLSDGQTLVPDIAAWKAVMNDPDNNPATKNPIEVTSIGLGSPDYRYLDAASSSGSAIRTPDPADLKDTVLQSMFVTKAEGNLLENDVQIDRDAETRLSQIVIGNEVFKITASNQLEVGNASGKVTATYDAASSLLSLKTAAGLLTVYMNTSPGHKAGDFIFRGHPSLEINLDDDADYVYQYTIVNSKGESQVSDLHVLAKVQGVGPDSVVVTSMGKDLGTKGDFITGDDSAGRLISGTIKSELADGLKLQVSTDGGAHWHDVTLVGRQWAFVDMQVHSADWDIQTRFADGNGNDSGVLASQHVTLVQAAGAPSITRIPEAESIYTTAKAGDGSQVILSLAGTGAKAGDTVHIQWGSTTHDQVLTQLDINSGAASINVPASATYTAQGAARDFSVTAQIINADGAVGAVSKPYHVVGTPTMANVADTLQRAPVDNEYRGTGFKVSTTGSLSKTAATPTTLAGLTVSGNTQSDAHFMLDKPASYFTLRLTGIDNTMGAQIQVFDVKGNLIHSENFIGGADARHSKLFSFTAQELVDIGSFKVLALSPSITLDAFSQRVVTHTAETRDPNLIDHALETFHGTAGEDVVSLGISATTYFNQAAAAIHGGSGIDTLKLMGGNHVLDLAKVGGKLSSMEVIDLTGTGNNTLTLGLSHVLDNGAVDGFYAGDENRVQMLVKGNAGDRVNLSDLLSNGSDFGDWVKVAKVAVDGVTYDSYQHSSLGAELLVQEGVTVTVTNAAATGVKSGYEVQSDAPAAAAMLTLTLSQVMNEGAVNLFHEGEQGRTQLMVKGGAGDSINLDDALDDGTDAGDWVVHGSQVVGGVTYEVYQHTGMAAELLVQEAVTVNLI